MLSLSYFKVGTTDCILLLRIEKCRIIYYYGYACGVQGSYVPKLPSRNLWTSILSVMYWIRTHENIYRIFQLF